MARSATRRRSAERPETREQLLETALEAFGELGFQGATTREIARRADVNLGLFSYYFDGKEDLWRACVDRAFGELNRAMIEAVGPDEALPARVRQERRLRAFLTFAARRPEFMRIMMREGMEGGPRMRWLIDHHVKPVFELIRRETAEGAAPSNLPAPNPVHMHYLVVGAAMMFGVGPEVQYLTGEDPADEDNVRAWCDAVVALLLGPSTDPSGVDR